MQLCFLMLITCYGSLVLWFYHLVIFSLWQANAFWRIYWDINIYISWCCRVGPLTCPCNLNHRCLVKSSVIVWLWVINSSFLLSKESFDLHWIHKMYHPMPKPCLWCVYLENLHTGAAKSRFRVFCLHCKQVVSLWCNVLCSTCSSRNKSL